MIGEKASIAKAEEAEAGAETEAKEEGEKRETVDDSNSFNFNCKCKRRVQVSDEPIILKDGSIKVYKIRWFMLAAYGLTMFSWRVSIARVLSITPSYAHFHDTTNEISSEIGIDAWNIAESIVLLASYFFGGFAIDKWGLSVMILGSFALTMSSWLWFWAGEDTLLVLLARVFGAFFAPLVSASLLAISNRFFPHGERAKATALGSLINVIGVGTALLVAPQFATASAEVVDLNLKSCQNPADFVVEAFQAAEEQNTTLSCVGDFLVAKDEFCCYLPVDIELLNLSMALFQTFAFVFTLLTVRSLPPSPPSRAAMGKPAVGLSGIKNMLKNFSFLKLTLSDFLVSGPPLVLVATISRIFPSSIAEYSFIASATGLGLAIPVALVYAHYLAKTRAYWTFGFAGYLVGTICWIGGAIAAAFGGIGDFVFLAFIVAAIACFIAWQVSIFELKLEYVFLKDANVEGAVVAIDRIVINIASLTFLAAIPPERVNTLAIGCIIMVAGLLPVILIRNKYRYYRQEFENNYAV